MDHLEQVVRGRMGIKEPPRKKKRHRIDRMLDELEAAIEAFERKYVKPNEKK